MTVHPDQAEAAGAPRATRLPPPRLPPLPRPTFSFIDK
jgi:hypothetical protein